MKITIRFQHSDSPTWPCSAIVDTETKKCFAVAIGKTWAEAEAEAIAKAKALLNAGLPPEQEEVEI